VVDVTDSVDKTRYAISESSQEMIATVEQLHERGYELQDQVVSAIGELGEGLAEISWELDNISDGVNALNAKFDWGFSRMISGIGHVNDSLQELIVIAKTPAETWAYEQYEISRDAIRRALYPEAVEALLRATNGHGDHVGYKLEYRFHYTLGILHLGDVQNTDPAILDLAKAETCFHTAARYAKTDYPMEAGVALTAAGWAAYCQGKLAEAESYTRQAVSIHPQHGEAFYQLAKIQMHTGRPKEAIPNLRRAIELDPHYTIKAATDPDFLKFEADLQALLASLRQDAERNASATITEAKARLQALEEWEVEDAFESEMASLRKSLAKAEFDYASNTYLGLLDAQLRANQLSRAGIRLLKLHRTQLEEELAANQNNLLTNRTQLQSRKVLCSSRALEQADVLLRQVRCDLESHDDYYQKKMVLTKAFAELKQFIQESRDAIQRRDSHGKNESFILGLVVGGLIGAVVGVLPAGLISLFVAGIANSNPKEGHFFEVLYPTWIILTLLVGVIGAFIGVQKFTSGSVARHESLVSRLGPEPSLTWIERKRSAFPLDDALDIKRSSTRTSGGGKAVKAKVTFDVIMVSVPGNKKISAIKAVRELKGLDLAEAKAVVERLPLTIMECESRADADAVKKKLEQAGVTVEVV